MIKLQRIVITATLILLMIIGALGCREKEVAFSMNSAEDDWELEQASVAYGRFHDSAWLCYQQMDTNLQCALEMSDVLLKRVNQMSDSNSIKWEAKSSMFELQAELFYRLNCYEQSIHQVRMHQRYDRAVIGEAHIAFNEAVALASNYVKLGELDSAKAYIDSADSSFSESRHEKGNFFEVMHDRRSALAQYTDLVSDNYLEDTHPKEYKRIRSRIEELNKSNPSFLSEIDYPSSRSDFERQVGDESIAGNKAFESIQNIYELRGYRGIYTISMYKTPKQTKSKYYWMKIESAANGTGSHSGPQYDVYVDTLSFTVNHFDTVTQKIMSLQDYRKQLRQEQ